MYIFRLVSNFKSIMVTVVSYYRANEILSNFITSAYVYKKCSNSFMREYYTKSFKETKMKP